MERTCVLELDNCIFKSLLYHLLVEEPYEIYSISLNLRDGNAFIAGYRGRQFTVSEVSSTKPRL